MALYSNTFTVKALEAEPQELLSVRERSTAASGALNQTIEKYRARPGYRNPKTEMLCKFFHSSSICASCVPCIPKIPPLYPPSNVTNVCVLRAHLAEGLAIHRLGNVSVSPGYGVPYVYTTASVSTPTRRELTLNSRKITTPWWTAAAQIDQRCQ